MVNLENKLTIDDLIIEYMMYKVKNGYEPSFLTSEFMNFISFFESKMQIEDSLYDNIKLFQRFFERKAEHDWLKVINWGSSEKKIVTPHMDMIYSYEDNDYLIKANYKFSDSDKSTINTFFMDPKEVSKIRSIIGEYLSNYPKRKIDENVKINENDLLIGKYISAEIIINIWESYINTLIKNHKWPIQCTDINKYLFDNDLAEIIGVESIKNKLLQLYNELQKRIAILYHQDNNLKISTISPYLAISNYELLIKDYEEIINIAFESQKKALDIDFSTLTFKESHKINSTYFEDDDYDVKITTSPLINDNTKKLIKILDKNI